MTSVTTSVRESYALAWRMYWREGFWSYSVICFLVGSTAILALVGAGVWFIVPGLALWGEHMFGISGWWVTLIAWIIYCGLLLVLMKPVILLAMGPVLQRVSDETSRRLKDQGIGSGPKPGVVRGLYDAFLLGIRNTILEGLLQGLLLLLGLLVPFLGGIAGTVLGTMVSAYFWGFSVLDFVLEGRGFSSAQKIRFVRRYRQETTFTGLIFLLLILIPVAGMFLAPVLGVMAATILANGLMQKNPDSNPFASGQTHIRM